ncbi:hypothetical protein TNCV_2202131 [Trichonephila clavipes]|uniref:Uncharacterized protein n=1 Tax=Trichonephila clavipes TaxID=2585209 RepID=A0A8X6UR94_TRICX|nr:hypothetical protein TNCV_2202131 [Trichonephila clavipes]
MQIQLGKGVVVWRALEDYQLHGDSLEICELHEGWYYLAIKWLKITYHEGKLNQLKDLTNISVLRNRILTIRCERNPSTARRREIPDWHGSCSTLGRRQ